MKDMLRTHNIGEVNESLSGKEVSLCGWVDSVRHHGKVSFIDLRDRYGKVQCVVVHSNADAFEKTSKLTIESCIKIKGKVKARPKGAEKKELSTGNVEIEIEKLEVFSLSDPLPFDLSKGDEVSEEIRLKYRYLDLRRPKMVANLKIRHEVIKFIRDFLHDKGFFEITTPILTKSTPEGARDFIVPSRLHPGKFYALPQSPQQYKQLLMVAGMDKYFQIAPCFRDEDARADRSPGEFYQLDLEMSFIEQGELLHLIEELFTKIVKKFFPKKKLTHEPFLKLSYDEVMKKYKSDKPDLRKDKNDSNELAFAWVVDFPLFEEEKKEGHYAPMHHMFTRPKDEDLKYLNKKDAHKVKSYQHDLVLNGFEVGGGSIRIHDPKVQQTVFDLIGFSEEENKYFEHMLTAFKFGVPPHGGIAPGIDRMLMVLTGESSLREFIAFPKNREARDVLMDAPSTVAKKQLDEVHIAVIEDKKKSEGKTDAKSKKLEKKTVKKNVGKKK